MKYSDEQRIIKIYQNAVKLQEYITGNNVKKEDLLTDIPLQWLVTTPLYNIGEHVYQLSGEYKDTQRNSANDFIKNPSYGDGGMA